jgi:hypothetical protein
MPLSSTPTLGVSFVSAFFDIAPQMISPITTTTAIVAFLAHVSLAAAGGGVLLGRRRQRKLFHSDILSRVIGGCRA